MRRLLFILLVSLLVLPAAALAATRAAGDGTLVVKNGTGTITVAGRGTIFGHFAKGTLTVVDYNPDDNKDPQVNGATKTFVKSDTTTVYKGSDVRFLFSGGRYKIVFLGSGIDISAVGKGTVTLLADPNVTDAGMWAVDGRKLQPLPVFTQTQAPFGVTP